jgi:uncharacterized damage-inducible protein DinB
MLNLSRQGIIGALLDEYQNVIDDLKTHIANLTDTELATIVDTQTSNKDCVSIQSVLTHIIWCSYNYVTMIDMHRNDAAANWTKRVTYSTIADYNAALDTAFEHNVRFFENINDSEMAQFAPENKLTTFWGQLYDYEQLMEHAIVHVSRHRRQIQKFIAILRAI